MMTQHYFRSIKDAFLIPHSTPVVFLTILSLLFVSTFISISEITTTIQDVNADAPLQSLWVATGCIKLLKNPLSYFDFKSFVLYGIDDNFAYNDLMFSQSILALPVHFLFKNPMLDFNFTTILMMLLNTIGVYFLCYYLTRDKFASVLGGIVFGLSPRMIHDAEVSHVPNIFYVYLPFAILCFIYYYRTGKTKHLIGFYILFLLQILIRWYNAIILSIIFSAFMIDILIEKFDKKRIIIIFSVLLLVGVSTLPFYFPYKNYYDRVGIEEVSRQRVNFGAEYISYFIPKKDFPTPLVYFIEKCLKVELPELRYFNINFLGYTPLAFIFVFTLYIFKKGKFRRSQIAIYYAYLLIGFVLSLGMVLYVNGRLANVILPWYYIYKYIPTFRFMRTIFHFNTIPHFFTAILFAMAFTQYFAAKSHKCKFIIFLILCSLLLIEYFPLKRILPRRKITVPEIYNYIKSNNDIKIFAEVPFVESRYDINLRFFYAAFHQKYVLMMTQYHYRPFKQTFINSQISQFPNPPAFQLFKDMGINYILVHDHYKYDALKNIPYVDEVYQTKDDVLYKINDKIAALDLWKQADTYFKANPVRGGYFLNYGTEDIKNYAKILTDNKDKVKIYPDGSDYIYVDKLLYENVDIFIEFFTKRTPGYVIDNLEITYKCINDIPGKITSVFKWESDESKLAGTGLQIFFDLITDGKVHTKRINLKEYLMWVQTDFVCFGFSLPAEYKTKFKLISVKMEYRK